jgi:hypothetical protein
MLEEFRPDLSWREILNLSLKIKVKEKRPLSQLRHPATTEGPVEFFVPSIRDEAHASAVYRLLRYLASAQEITPGEGKELTRLTPRRIYEILYLVDGRACRSTVGKVDARFGGMVLAIFELQAYRLYNVAPRCVDDAREELLYYVDTKEPSDRPSPGLIRGIDVTSVVEFKKPRPDPHGMKPRKICSICSYVYPYEESTCPSCGEWKARLE